MSRKLLDASCLLAWIVSYAVLVGVNRLFGLGDRLVTPSGVGTLLQVVAAIIIALYAVSLASLFVLVQIIAPNRGQRSVRMLMLEPWLRAVVAGAVVVTLLAVFLAGQVPDSVGGTLRVSVGRHAPLVAGVADWAAALGELVAVVVIVLTVLLAKLFHDYGSPTDFRDRIVSSVGGRVRGDRLEEAGKVLRQWTITSARDGASRDLKCGCDAAIQLTKSYVKTTPDFRRSVPSGKVEAEAGVLARDDCVVLDGWFIDQLGRTLVRAIEEAARANSAWRNLDHLIETYRTVTEELIEAGLEPDALLMIRGLVEIGALIQQTESQRMTAWFSARPLQAVVALDTRIHALPAATSPTSEAAVPPIHAACLAAWCCLVSEVGRHESGGTAIDPLGDHDDAAWDSAAELLPAWSKRPSWSLGPAYDAKALVSKARHPNEPVPAGAEPTNVNERSRKWRCVEIRIRRSFADEVQRWRDRYLESGRRA